MPSINLQNLVRRNPARPSLKDRAATLKAGLARFGRRKPSADVEPVAAAVSSLDDSVLLALEADFRAADLLWLSAQIALTVAWKRYVEPPMPIQLNPWRGDWMHAAIPRARTVTIRSGKIRSLPYAAEEVEQMRGRRCLRQTYDDDGELQPDGRRMVLDTKVQDRVDGIVAAWDLWQAEIVAAKVTACIPEMKTALLGTEEVRNSLLQRIRETPARSIVGLGAKARVAGEVCRNEDVKDEGLRSYSADEPEALPFDIAGDVLGILAGAADDETSHAPLESLLLDLKICDAAYEAADPNDEPLNERLSEELWTLRERICEAPVTAAGDLRVKAMAARMALKRDADANCVGPGSFVGLSLSIIDHLAPQTVG